MTDNTVTIPGHMRVGLIRFTPELAPVTAL